MKYTVLVSGASGIVGYGIVRSLKECGCYVIGTTIYNISPADCFADAVERAPLTSDCQYIPWLISIMEKYNVDMIIPGIEADVSSWNYHRRQLEEVGAVVMLNCTELIDTCLDKWRFYQKLCEHNFENRIKTSIFPDLKQFSIPFILKPRCGFGGRGIIKVESWDQFEKYKNKVGTSLMMQEYVGSEEEEYTVSAFFNRNSCMQAIISLKRKLSPQGFTDYAEVIPSGDLENIVMKLASFFSPIGPTNFQFRKQHGRWRLLEINPRISSSTSIRTAFGYNESKMCIDYFLRGKEISQPAIRKGRAVRYTEDYIFYDSNYL